MPSLRRAERVEHRVDVHARLAARPRGAWAIIGAALSGAIGLVAFGVGPATHTGDGRAQALVVEQTQAGLFNPGSAPAPQGSPVVRGDQPTLVYAQPPLQGNLGVGPFGLIAATSACVFGYGAADDFTLAQDRPISRIGWQGVYFGPEIDHPGDDRSVSVTIYRDNGAGNIGQVVLHLDNVGPVKSRNPRPPVFGLYPVYDYAVDVNPPFVAQQGQRYWISVNIDAGGFLGPLWGWLASATGNAAQTPGTDQPLVAEGIACASIPQITFVPGGPQGFDADLAFALYSECAPADCNCNGRADGLDVQTGHSADCNRNGLPDECDIAEGRSTDCDSDGVPDECQLLPNYSATSPEMRPTGAGNPNQWTAFSVPRAAGPVTITVRARSDLNLATETLKLHLAGAPIADVFIEGGNDCPALPDVATIQIPAATFNEARNASGHVTFRVDSSSLVSPTLCGAQQFVQLALNYRREDGGDLDGNGVYDPCDVLAGAADCNGNGIIDEFELDGPYESSSPTLSPFGAGANQSHTLVLPPMATGDVVIQVAARGDFSAADEFVEILVNNVVRGRVLESGGRDCPVLPDVGQLVIPASAWNAMAHGRQSVVVQARPSFAVSVGLCGSSSAVITVAYRARGQKDCDVNGILDECDIASGRSTDYNHNGRPDHCDKIGDINGDHMVNAVDLAMLLADWNTSLPRSDLDRDGRVNSRDLGILLAYYGQ